MTTTAEALKRLHDDAKAIAFHISAMLYANNGDRAAERFGSEERAVEVFRLNLQKLRALTKDDRQLQDAQLFLEQANAETARRWSFGTAYSMSAHSWLHDAAAIFSQFEADGRDLSDADTWMHATTLPTSDGEEHLFIFPDAEDIEATLLEANEALDREYLVACRELLRVPQAMPQWSKQRSPQHWRHVLARDGLDISQETFLSMIEKGQLRVIQHSTKSYQIDIRDLPPGYVDR